MDSKQYIFYKKHINSLCLNTKKILEKYELKSIFIDSGALRQSFLDDYSYPFKANPHFVHWCPLSNVPKAYIWYRIDKVPVLFYPNADDFWHKTTLLPNENNQLWAKEFEIIPYTEKEQVKNIIISDSKNCAYVGENIQIFQDWNLKSYNDQNLLTELHFFRTIKSEYEVDCLYRANLKAIVGHSMAKAAFFQGKTELEIHLEYLKSINSLESKLPYSNIIAINENASILHYTAINNNKIDEKNRNSFLIDAGAKYNGYCADITRTYSYKKGLFSEILESFKKMQIDIIKSLKIGQCYTDLHIQTHHRIAQILIDYKIVTGMSDPVTLEKEKITHTFFPHGLGHFLGIQVHDVGGIKKDPPKEHQYLRCTMNIAPGHVFTIEPGLYFIPILLNKLKDTPLSSCVNWQLIESLIPFGGIRIENNISCNTKEFQDLTLNAFNELQLVDSLSL